MLTLACIYASLNDVDFNKRNLLSKHIQEYCQSFTKDQDQVLRFINFTCFSFRCFIQIYAAVRAWATFLAKKGFSRTTFLGKIGFSWTTFLAEVRSFYLVSSILC